MASGVQLTGVWFPTCLLQVAWPPGSCPLWASIPYLEFGRKRYFLRHHLPLSWQIVGAKANFAGEMRGQWGGHVEDAASQSGEVGSDCQRTDTCYLLCFEWVVNSQVPWGCRSQTASPTSLFLFLHWALPTLPPGPEQAPSSDRNVVPSQTLTRIPISSFMHLAKLLLPPPQISSYTSHSQGSLPGPRLGSNSPVVGSPKNLCFSPYNMHHKWEYLFTIFVLW